MRGGGRVLAEAALVADGLDAGGPMGGLEQVVGDEPSPEFAAMVAEQYRLFDMNRLERMVLKEIAHEYFILPLQKPEEGEHE